MSICFVRKAVKEQCDWHSDCVLAELEPAIGVENT